jgi:hypothetical protein
MQMNAKRLECAWLLREFAWALKRYADRIERCCTQNPNDDNERKAQQWVDRARERMARFHASRWEYLNAEKIAASTKQTTVLLADILRHFKVSSQPSRNPWRAGQPPFGYVGRVRMYINHGCTTGGIMQVLDGGPVYTCQAWRPA